MEQMIDFFNYCLEAMRNFGDNSDSFFERVIVWGIVFYFELKIQVLQFSYSIASGFLDHLNISGLINSTWGSMDSSILGALTYLRIPESLNIILTALTTRYVMDLLP